MPVTITTAAVLLGQIAAAADEDALTALWEAHADVWSDEHTAAVRAHLKTYTCVHCFRPVEGERAPMLGEHLACNHEHVNRQLLDWLRERHRDRSTTPDQRQVIEAWVRHLTEQAQQ